MSTPGQIKAVSSSNSQTTLVFPLPPILSCLGDKSPFPGPLTLDFSYSSKELMCSVLSTSLDTRRNHDSPSNLPRVTQSVGGKPGI